VFAEEKVGQENRIQSMSWVPNEKTFRVCVPAVRRSRCVRVMVNVSYEFVVGTQIATLFFGWHSSITLKYWPGLGEEARTRTV
jgi:hypothetical protein